jgi:hypothetical protein
MNIGERSQMSDDSDEQLQCDPTATSPRPLHRLQPQGRDVEAAGTTASKIETQGCKKKRAFKIRWRGCKAVCAKK